MRLPNVLQSREWAIARRAVIAGLILVATYRLYGDAIFAWIQHPDAGRDVVITRAEFRPDIPGAKPAWIIGLKNESRRFTYEEIEVEATYLDKAGAVLQKDKLLVHQKLTPGQDKLIGSADFKERPGATAGRLKVLK